MRRRSTFIPSPGSDYDPSEIKISEQGLFFAGIKAAREEKVTFGISNLPRGMKQVLDRSHELHFRWVSEEPYQKSGPYLSSLTPGLHVHYTPLEDTQDDEGLCQMLREIFAPSLRCSTPNNSFSRPQLTSQRFASAASLQYYSVLPSLEHAVAWFRKKICWTTDLICVYDANLLDIASYIDLDYNGLSHTLTLTAYWPKPPSVLTDSTGEWTAYDHWNLAIDGGLDDRNELGILRSSTSRSPAAEPNELELEGFLTVIGQDEVPKPTVFSFPSRHHVLTPEQADSQLYTVTFDQPTGLHPTMRISFTSPSQKGQPPFLRPPINKPADSTCALHAYFTLPSVLFPDEYAFPSSTPDPLFTSAHNILFLRSLSGERDLEAPDYVVQKWGSAMLLELATPNTTSASSTWDITVPLHLRYLTPTSGGIQTIRIPNPIVFWACTAEQGTKFSVSPFDRTNLGYDGLFGPRTMFYHLEAKDQDSRLVQEVGVPVLDSDEMGFELTELLTGLLVLGGFLYVAFRIVKEVMGMSVAASKAHTKKIQ